MLLIVGLAIGGGGGYFFLSSTYQPKIEEYEAQVTDLTSEVSSLTSTVAELETENSNYETQVSDLENEVSALNITITVCRAFSSALERRISGLESKLDEAEDAISDYEEQVSELKSQISFFRSILERQYESTPIQIGITATSTEVLLEVQAVGAIAEDDINNYCKKQEYPFTFEFIIKNNYGEAVEAVGNTREFNEMGIKLIVGHGSSSQCDLSLNYATRNDMLMLSPSADARLLAIPDDNLFRTCPTDLVQAPALAASLDSWGIEAAIVIQRGDEWGDGIYKAFKDEFEARGGVVFERIRYDPDIPTFGGTLNGAEDAAKEAIAEYGEGGVAIQIISLDEAAKMLEIVQSFPTIYNLYWFGTDSTTKYAKLFEFTPTEADHLKLFGPVVAQEDNTIYRKFRETYSAITGQIPDFYTLAMYDACWLYALSIFRTWTAEAPQVKQALPEVAEDYYGASGWCRLNEDGDRYAVDYEIWGYGLEDGKLIEVKYGYYDITDGQVTWYANTGITPLG